MRPSQTAVKAPPVVPRTVLAEPPRRELLLVTHRDSASFQRALEGLDADIRTVDSVEAAVDALGHQTAGVILHSPLAHKSAEEALTLLASLDEARRRPVFVAVGEGFDDDRAQALYDDGATAVIAWPQEILLLPQLVNELATVSLADHEAASVDEALSEATQARIDLDADLASLIRCQVRNGVAHLHGTLDSLWKHRRLVDRISAVPGVVAVVEFGLEVLAPSVADDALSTALGTTFAANTKLEDQTVSASVADGVVTLAGVVKSKRQLREAVRLAESIRGVARVDNHVCISPGDAVVGQDHAATLQKLVDQAFPKSSAVVKCFGPVAVVSGSAPTLAERVQIQECLEDAGFIERVVNKVTLLEAGQSSKA